MPFLYQSFAVFTLAFFFGHGQLVLLICGAAAFFFIAEAKISGDAFFDVPALAARPKSDSKHYLETLLAREDKHKRSSPYQLGERFLQRYSGIFLKLFKKVSVLSSKRKPGALLLV